MIPRPLCIMENDIKPRPEDGCPDAVCAEDYYWISIPPRVMRLPLALSNASTSLPMMSQAMG